MRQSIITDRLIFSFMRPFSCLIHLLATTGVQLHAGNLYSTDFEAFPPGDNQWSGTEGWLSTDTTSGAQGILPNAAQNLQLGKTAYLGYGPPTSDWTTVYKPINYDPATTQIPIIEFDSLLGIQDSSNARRDRFYVSFYNSDNFFLAGICFDNTTGEVSRDDGSIRSGTNVEFLRGNQLLGLITLQVLSARINLVTNQWSAALDGITLFKDAPFTATGQARILGASAVEWEVVKTNPTLEAGNNWLFVADWNLRTVPVGNEPFTISSITKNPDSSTTLTWPGNPGFDYKIEHSSDLIIWHNDLPGASLPSIQSNGPLSFTDTTAPLEKKFYRARREVSP
jgi:hypothetical protein